MYKCIVAGKRDCCDRDFVFQELDTVFHEIGMPAEIIEGGAPGVDTLARAYAVSRKIPYKEFRAKWGTYGKAAGPIRNREMAEYASLCANSQSSVLIAFWDGKSRGTKNMIDTAEKLGIRAIVIDI